MAANYTPDLFCPGMPVSEASPARKLRPMEHKMLRNAESTMLAGDSSTFPLRSQSSSPLRQSSTADTAVSQGSRTQETRKSFNLKACSLSPPDGIAVAM